MPDSFTFSYTAVWYSKCIEQNGATSGEHLVPSVWMLKKYSSFKDLYPIRCKYKIYINIFSVIYDSIVKLASTQLHMCMASVPAGLKKKNGVGGRMILYWQCCKLPLAAHTVQPFCTHSEVQIEADCGIIPFSPDPNQPMCISR